MIAIIYLAKPTNYSLITVLPTGTSADPQIRFYPKPQDHKFVIIGTSFLLRTQQVRTIYICAIVISIN